MFITILFLVSIKIQVIDISIMLTL